MDFFSAVVAGSTDIVSEHAVDDTKTFADAIAARFGQGDQILTARLLPPLSVRMPSTPMANLSLSIRQQPLQPEPGTFTAVPPLALSSWIDDPSTLIVDIRPHAAYSSARICRAISLSVPSTLLKRPLFSLQRLSAMLPSSSARSRFSAWRTAPRILVYDADSPSLSDTSNIQGLLRKFLAESPPGATIDLAWVQGGFQAVWRDRRDLVDAVPPTPETETEDEEDDADYRVLRAHNLPQSAFALSSTTSAQTRPSTRPGSAQTSFNPFFDTVRQNTELSHGITERIPLRLPRRVRRRISELPFQWLRDIARRAGASSPILPVPPSTAHHHTYLPVNAYTLRHQQRIDSSDDSSDSSSNTSGSAVSARARHAAQAEDVEEGSEALAMQFYRIELAEQRRLMGVMEHHSRESESSSRTHSNDSSSRTNSTDSTNPTSMTDSSDSGSGGGVGGVFPFSITAGFEKGSKNRYRHIWPFEHARVRLHRRSAPPRTVSLPSKSTPDAHIALPSASSSADALLHSTNLNPNSPSSTLPTPDFDLDDPISPLSKPPSPFDDYVNASYVQPLCTTRRYIATQGPLEATYGDFWNMCWQQDVRVIVMLTQEVEGSMVKCGRYWTEGVYNSERGSAGAVRVEAVGCAVCVGSDGAKGVRRKTCAVCGFADVSAHSASTATTSTASSAGGFFQSASTTNSTSTSTPAPQLIKRFLRVTHAAYPDAPPRRVVQLQYLGWPDMNVPEDARGVLGLVWEVGRVMREVGGGGEGSSAEGGDGSGRNGSEVREGKVDPRTGVVRRAGPAPVLLHCSAGVGRTGGFIAVDAVLDAVRREVREWGVQGEGEDRMDVDVEVPAPVGLSLNGGGGLGVSGDAPLSMNGIGNGMLDGGPGMSPDGMRTPMQVDSEGSVGRWAERVADTKGVSASFPTTSTSFPSSLSSAAAFPLSAVSSSASLFPSSGPTEVHARLQAGGAHRGRYNTSASIPSGFSLTLPTHIQPRPHNSDPTAHMLAMAQINSDGAINKAVSLPTATHASLPAAGNAPLPLAVRRGYADHRLRTFSDPSAADTRPPAVSATSSSTWLLPPERKVSNSPLPDSDGARSLSPFAGAADKPQQNRTSSGEDSSEQKSNTERVDYKLPRALHAQEGAAPVRLSAMEDPIWEVVQDMREQRMSLCQSLRQYVFVHAAIIEGALMVLDEERAALGLGAGALMDMMQPGGWRGTQPQLHPVWSPSGAAARAVFAKRSKGPGPLSLPLSSSSPRPLLRPAARSDESQSTSSTGKRLASPTELPKEDKKGEIVLSKRPSIKRKQPSMDEYSAPPLPTYPPP